MIQKGKKYEKSRCIQCEYNYYLNPDEGILYSDKKIEELKQENVSQNKIIETLSIQNRELSKQFEKILNEIKILKGEYNKTKIKSRYKDFT